MQACETTRVMAHVGHELRNQLAVLRLAVDLATHPHFDEPTRTKSLRVIRETSEGLDHLLADLMDMLKLEQGRLRLTRQTFSLREMVRSVYDSFTLLAEEKGFPLACSIQPEAPDAMQGDPGRVRQILTNILSNAIKFTHQGGVSITVSGGMAQVRIAVQDSGIGIAPEALAHILDPYRQADDSIQEHYGGCGLGLALCKGLLEAMQGELQVESQPGQGSCFTISLPWQAGSVGARGERKSLIGETLLVVSDGLEETTRWVGWADALGLSVRLVGTPAQAVLSLAQAEARGHAFRFCLFDLGAGAEDGFCVLEQVAPQVRRATRVVAVSRYGRRGHAASCLELGLAAYMVNPLAADELAELLPALLEPNCPALVTRHTLRERRQRELTSFEPLTSGQDCSHPGNTFNLSA